MNDDFKDVEPNYLFTFPEPDVSLIVDALASFEEMMRDTADGYKKSRTDNYYRFWEYQAKQAERLRKSITQNTGIDQSTMDDYAVGGDVFNVKN